MPAINFTPSGKVVSLPLVAIPGTTAPAEVPCQLSMGSGILFEEITGHTFREFNASTKDACAFVYGCVVTGCARAGLKFDLSFAQFTHAIDPVDLNQAVAMLQEVSADEAASAGADEVDGEKKS